MIYLRYLIVRLLIATVFVVHVFVAHPKYMLYMFHNHVAIMQTEVV